jgi:uncharacterized RDD family membrane protein YckC
MSDYPAAPPVPGTGAATPAGIGQRLIARLIDGLVAFAMTIPAILLFLVGLAIGGAFGAILAFLGGLLYIADFAAIFYVMVWAQGVTGQTPGKRMQGIKLVDSSTGGPVGGSGGVIRWLVEAVTIMICYLGYIWALFDDRNQTLYDKILDNEVVLGEKGGIMPIFPDGKPF